MIQDLHDRLHGPGLGIVRAIHQTPNARVNQRPGAHGARFNCNKQIAVSKAVVTNGGTSFAQRHDLGMSGGVGVCDGSVPSAADDLAGAHDRGADRYFSGFQGALGAAQGFLHPELVRMRLVGGGRGSWVFGLGAISCFLWGHSG